MQIIKRNITYREIENSKLKLIGINSNNVLTFVINNSAGEEILINFHDDEINKIRDFLLKWE